MDYFPRGFILLVTVFSNDIEADDILSCFSQEEIERGEGFDLIELVLDYSVSSLYIGLVSMGSGVNHAVHTSGI
jgi:hypothetical protein